jgi:hypothetical protein
MHEAKSVSNKIRYQIGHKRCTFCGIFLSIEDARCICCKAVLRTKARSKKRSGGFGTFPLLNYVKTTYKENIENFMPYGQSLSKIKKAIQNILRLLDGKGS